MLVFIVYNVKRAEKSSGNLFIRRIPGLNAIDEAIGRATEMGRPVLMVPGIGALNAISVQAINIFAKVTQTAAKFATPVKICVADAAVYTVAQETIRDVYQREGCIERYNVETVQFVSDRQFAFAAGVAGMIRREKAAATFFLGEFYAESLIFAESANAEGAIQVAGSTQTTQTPFFVAACDYVLIGDEYYAASAYLTREPILVGSLVGQDWCKILIAVSILVGFVSNSFERTQPRTEIFEKGTSRPITPEELEKGSKKRTEADTFMNRLFKNSNPPALDPKDYDREIDTEAKDKADKKAAEAESAGGGA
jgi:hypothetical protein